MTLSPMQIAANRCNALKSTGPRSIFGKLKSSRNARRHGLSVQTALTEEVRQLARAILEPVPIELRTPALDNWAHLVAQAEFDLERARAAKRDVYRRLPIQNAALVTQAHARGFDAGAERGDSHALMAEPSTQMMRQAIGELRKIDRYEGRALSRRRKAALTYRSHVKQILKQAEKRGGN
jgi:hypothetical protein